MLRTLAIIGNPGTGKSTLMRKIMDLIIDPIYSPAIATRLGLLDYIRCYNTAFLGKYDDPNDKFPGTDKLSMAVQPDAEHFLRVAGDFDIEAIVWEGDRLSNSSFFTVAREVSDFRLIALECSSEVLQQRRAGRSAEVGKAQDATWLKGRLSKVARLQQDFQAGIAVVNTDAEMNFLSRGIATWIIKGKDDYLPKADTLF